MRAPYLIPFRPPRPKINLQPLVASLKKESKYIGRFYYIFNNLDLKRKVFKENFYYRKFELELSNIDENFFLELKNFFFSNLSNYVFHSFLNKEALNLYNNLINILFYSASIVRILKDKEQIVSGVYIIFNINTEFAYIGQSVNIVERFKQHKEMLIKGKHHNSNLQHAFNKERIDVETLIQTDYTLQNFIFLFLEVGLVSKQEREYREQEYIRTWPGYLYNH